MQMTHCVYSLITLPAKQLVRSCTIPVLLGLMAQSQTFIRSFHDVWGLCGFKKLKFGNVRFLLGAVFHGSGVRFCVLYPCGQCIPDQGRDPSITVALANE